MAHRQRGTASSRIATLAVGLGMLTYSLLIFVGVVPTHPDNLAMRIFGGLLSAAFGLSVLAGVFDKNRGAAQGRVDRVVRRGPFWAGAATDGHSAGVGFGIGTPVDPLDTSDEEGPGIEFRR